MAPADDDARFMDLFETALRLSPEERRAHVAAACGDDPALAQEILERVAVHEAMGDFLLEPLIARDDLDVRFAPGQWVSGRFKIVREVGEGGMGTVYEALDAKLDQRCALKCAKRGFARRLPAEARSALRITHDNVCRVYGIHVVEAPGGPCDLLAMEFLDGETLAERVERAGPLPDAESRDVARQVCAGLAAAHREGVLHRDLKSNNVMLTASTNGRCRAVITDFGLARQDLGDRNGRTSRASDGPGASSYTAPELLAGEPATEASDVYSLGVVLHEMVTGRLPAGNEPGSTAPTIFNRVTTGLGRRWDRCIRRCLADRPAARPVSAAAVAAALDDRRAKTWRWAAAAVMAIATGVLTFGAFPRPGDASIRLALLPFDARNDGGDRRTAVTGGGVLHDLSDRLQRLRPSGHSFVVIPLSETLKYGVTNPEQARTTLGATHVLTGSLSRLEGNGRIRLQAAVIDARTLVTAKDMSADYVAGEIDGIPVALAGTITAAFRLKTERFDAPIGPAAYDAYSQGMFNLRSGAGGVDPAIGAFETAARLDPRSALPHAALTEAFVTKYGDTDDDMWLERARQTLAAAESRDPDLAAVRMAAGRVHRVLGMHDRAIDDYTRATELEPNNVAAWIGRARAYEAARTRAADAAQAYQRAVDLQPDYYLPHLEFAAFHQFRGNYERAEHHLLRATAIAPNLVPPYTNLGGLYADMGRYPDAERMLRRSLELEESSAALTNLGAVLNYQGRDREALTFYRQALARGQPNFVLLVNVGDSCRRAGLASEATDAYRQGLELADREVMINPSNGYARAFVAYFAARLRQGATARRELEQALHFAPEDGKVIRRAVLTFETLGERRKTLALLQKAPPAVLHELSRQPDLQSLRQDPAFQHLVRAAGKTVEGGQS